MTIDVLYPLVQSLSKSEKRYCRLLAGRQSGDKPNEGRGFLRLFDCLLAHETPGEALTAELARQFPGTTLEPARKYLYRVIMQSLRQFEQKQRVEVRIGQLLHDSQILYERGLVQASLDQVTKARHLAEQHEQGLYAVLAARQQAEQWVRLQFDRVDEATLAGLHAQIRQQLDRSQTALHHAALYETLLFRYQTRGFVSSPSDTARLNDLLLEEYQLLNRQKQKSFAIQQQHLHFQSAYFRMIGDGAGSLRVYRELETLFAENPTLWTHQPLYYVHLLEGILADLRLLGQYDEMPYFIDRLRLIDTPVQGLNRTVPYLALYFSLLRFVDKQRYTDAATLLTSHQTDPPVFERGISQLPLPIRTEFNLLLVRLSLGLGQLSAGLQRLNRVLALPVRTLPGMLYTQSRLLNLLLHARLGNADYLTHALRSVERKRRTAGPSLPAERFTLDLLHQWLNGRLRVGVLEQIDQFRGSPADQQLLQNADVRAWAVAVLKIS